MLLVCSVFALASCGDDKLSGTYETTVEGVTFSYTFEGNRVTATASVYADMGIDAFSGTYSIKDDKITFVFEAPVLEDATLQSVVNNMVTEMNEHNKDLSFAKDSDSITIDGMKLTKKK